MMDLDTLKARNLGAVAKAGFAPAPEPKPERLHTWQEPSPGARAAFLSHTLNVARAAAAE